AAFADEEKAKTIPDPTAEATFRRSILDWAERELSPHREVLADTTALLHLRQREVVPLTKTAWQGGAYALPRPDVVDVTWSFAGGTLRFVGVFGGDAYAPGPLPGRVIWRSPSVSQDENGSLVLPAWSGVFVKEVR
ncbi:1,4-alpha-glucan branching protein, partial [Methylobacterium tarhaniae]